MNERAQTSGNFLPIAVTTLTIIICFTVFWNITQSAVNAAEFEAAAEQTTTQPGFQITTVFWFVLALAPCLAVVGYVRDHKEYPITTIGRVRDVSRLRGTIESCIECDASDTGGVLTHTCGQTVLFGVPVRTRFEAEHETCKDCLLATEPVTAVHDVGYDAEHVLEGGAA